MNFPRFSMRTHAAGRRAALAVVGVCLISHAGLSAAGPGNAAQAPQAGPNKMASLPTPTGSSPVMPDRPAGPSKFYDDDPIARETDPIDASDVQPFELHLAWDLVNNLFGKPGEPGTRRSPNISTIEEVPDSNWFTNRVGTLPLTEADVTRGPDTTDGPAAGPWTIVSGKSDGIRPGFEIVDAAGIRWFLKFDPPGYEELATSAEVVATKLFWMLGYNVPETHVATLRREDLVLGDHATIHDGNGRSRRLTHRDVEAVLAQSARSADGTYRTLASKALEGKPLGGFLHVGTRSDDPNDIVPHEDRRELRGLGVFAAWTDRVDAKDLNSLDMLVQENGRSVVRHYLLDFGSALGSAGIGPRAYDEGFEYIFEGKTTLRHLLGFGFPVASWRRIPYDAPRSVGRIDGTRFDPEAWKSRVPNAAYLRARPDDTFWAAQKLMAVNNGLIAAAVKAGRYSDPEAEASLTRILIQRRDAILRAYLPKVNPLVSPALDASTGVLSFVNAAVAADVARAPTAYRATWYTFDNATGASTLIDDPDSADVAHIQAPDGLPSTTGAFVRVDVSAVDGDYESWKQPVQVYFRRIDTRWKLVGLERLP